jgi:2-(1,2-epoxy-1,2-dihydrophenyl)acetyl-CoA isomerase
MTDERPLDEQIRFEVVNQVAWITIDRPEAGNALSPPCRDRIRDLVASTNATHHARAIVLTASGEKLFCPGADLAYPRESDRAEGVPDRVVGDARRMMLDGQYTLFPAILDSDLPIIAAVNGTAAGMGAHLALACDLVIAADNAKFIEVFSRRGLVVDALGAYLLPRLIPMHKAKELIFFAEDLPAADAERLGLVNRVVPAAELHDAATEWAERLASGPTRALSLSKWLLNQSLDADRQTMMNAESWAVEINTHSEDFAEGMASFRERRSPEWRGY